VEIKNFCLDFIGGNKEFLFGFYFRIGKDFEKAERYFSKALSETPNMPKARREMVTTLLGLSRYNDALQFAERNYNDKRTNPYHIEAYFRCLVKRRGKDQKDIEILSQLIEEMKAIRDPKSREIVETMEAEYNYYVNNDVAASIKTLLDLVKTARINYPAVSPKEIYAKQENYVASREVSEKYINDSKGTASSDSEYDHVD
jgi:tetratricopeptide (TPR) repeat protein